MLFFGTNSNMTVMHIIPLTYLNTSASEARLWHRNYYSSKCSSVFYKKKLVFEVLQRLFPDIYLKQNELQFSSCKFLL